MRVALLGRTRWLIAAGDALREAGHEIVAVATARDEPFYHCGPADFTALAKRSEAADFGVVSLADPTVREGLAKQQADVAVSVNWPVVVGAETIDIFPYGVVNAHCGDLPRYRGNACPNWAIINNEDRIGLSAHMMEPGELDAGAILLKDYLLIDDNTYIGDVYAWLDRRVPMLLAEAITGLANGSLSPEAQPKDPSLALRCYPRRPEDAKISWVRPVADVHRLIRASSRPFSGAFAELEDGRPLTIWRARPFEHLMPFCAVPGQIMFFSSDGPVVACGAGALLLEEFQVQGASIEESKIFFGRSVRARLK